LGLPPLGDLGVGADLAVGEEGVPPTVGALELLAAEACARAGKLPLPVSAPALACGEENVYERPIPL